MHSRCNIHDLLSFNQIYISGTEQSDVWEIGLHHSLVPLRAELKESPSFIVSPYRFSKQVGPWHEKRRALETKNRPFPSYLLPLCQNESSIVRNHPYENEFHLHVHFHALEIKLIFT